MFWVDGSPVADYYTNWEDEIEDKKCMIMDKTTQTWDRANCDSNYGYVCGFVN